MVPLSLALTDQELARKIQSSVLADDQKKELTTLLPQMTETERNELAKMIDDSVRDMIEADPELQKKVRALNEEYDLKIHNLVAEQSRHVRNEFEKLDTKDEANAMQSLEGEMEQVGSGPATQSHAELGYGSHPELGSGSTRKHPLLKFFFILVGFGVLVGAVLFGLQFL